MAFKTSSAGANCKAPKASIKAACLFTSPISVASKIAKEASVVPMAVKAANAGLNRSLLGRYLLKTATLTSVPT